MITDARVLQPEFIPREVQHRDAEVNYLSSVLNPITNGHRADPALLHGPSGAGKTCIAQYLVEQLREAVMDLNYQYVNCWEDHSRFKTLYRLLDGINQTVDIHRQSTPKDVLLFVPPLTTGLMRPDFGAPSAPQHCQSQFRSTCGIHVTLQLVVSKHPD